jgi:hypothetical protein
LLSARRHRTKAGGGAVGEQGYEADDQEGHRDEAGQQSSRSHSLKYALFTELPGRGVLGISDTRFCISAVL